MTTSHRQGAATHGEKQPARTRAGGSAPAEKIAARAYEIWVAHGRPQGHDTEHWLQAERELTAGKPARR